MGECTRLTQLTCKVLQLHYVTHHLHRYVRTLEDARYRRALRMPEAAAQRQVAILVSKRRGLHQRSA